MADIEWKGARWESALTDLSIPDLLTVLKGYGQMEVVRFEIPGRFRGEMSLCLVDDGTKEVTLYHLEVLGARRQGEGRAALKWLKRIFRGGVFLEFPDAPGPGQAFHPSLPFWLQMYREGLIDALDGEGFYLDRDSSSSEVGRAEEAIRSACRQMPPARS